MHAPNRDKGRIRLDPAKLKGLSDRDLAERISFIQPLVDGLADPLRRSMCENAVAGLGNGTVTDYRKALKQMKQEQARRDREHKHLNSVPWTPFVRTYVDPEQLNGPEAMARYAHLAAHDKEGRSADWWHQQYLTILNDEIYRNSRYQVNVRRIHDHPAFFGIELVHLSIKRIDQLPIHDWRDLQRIKNELVGPNCEAMELYPSEERVVDTANQYHLWAVNADDFRFPVGWETGLRMDVDASDDTGAKQRRFEA